MKLNTAQKFLILALHPDKARFLITQPALNAGFIGSVLMDLALDQRIEIRDGVLSAVRANVKSSAAQDLIHAKIEAAGKPKKIKRWIAKFVQSGRKYRHMDIRELEQGNYVKMEEKRFLIFPYRKIRLVNKHERNKLVMELRNAIIHGKPITSETAAILSIMDACKMHKILSTDKSDLSVIKSKMKDLVQKHPISEGVDKVIREMQAAIVGAVVASSVATSASH